jgi:hypothetical protein
VVAAVGQAQARQQLRGARAALRAGAGIDRRHFHVAGGVQVGQQVIALEDEAEVLAPQLRPASGSSSPVSRPATW